MVKLWFSLILLTVLSLVVTCKACNPNDTTSFKGMFIFGDDIGENGNNNHLITFYMKANFLPYGIDFPNGPSGRWSNGRSVIDCIADKLGLPYPPPFPQSDEKGTNILNGVNFASTGVGLLRITNMFTLGHIQHMEEQMRRYKDVIIPQLKKKFRCRASAFLPQYLFIIGLGNNDYSSWWILQQYHFVNQQVFAGMLVNHMSNIIKELYETGARKFLLISPYPLGCNPGIMGERTTCVEALNIAIQTYYGNLLILVQELKENQMPDAHFSIVNSERIIKDIYDKKTNSGIDVVDCACCDLIFGDICHIASATCLNRKQYLYFDGYHLTEAANCYMAKQICFSKNDKYITPLNVIDLMKIKIDNLVVDPPPLPLSPDDEPPAVRPPPEVEPPPENYNNNIAPMPAMKPPPQVKPPPGDHNKNISPMPAVKPPPQVKPPPGNNNKNISPMPAVKPPPKVKPPPGNHNNNIPPTPITLPPKN